MEFGDVVRRLRQERGLGLKRVAPEIGVTYTYLSKVENNHVRPSDDVVRRIAHYFDADRTQLLLAAGRVPEDVLQILRSNPEEAISYLRERFGARDDRQNP